MDTNPQYPSTPASRWRGAAINLALLCASLAVTYGIAELLLWRYENALMTQAGFFVPADPTVDGAAWDVDPAGFERFRWQDDGNSIVHIKSDNPGLVYELRPGAHISDTIRINADGFRDYEFSTEKPEGVYRIVVLGDSITFGWLQRQEEIYPKLLEAKLNATAAPGRRFEVYNMGVGGYHAGQELELLRAKALRYQPDLIIVGYCANDNQIGFDAGLWRHFSRSGSRTWDFISLRWMLYRERTAEKSLVERSYEGMAAAAKEAGVPLLALIFPDKLSPDGSPARQQEDLCRKLGIEALNLYPVFQKAGFDTVLADMVHPTTAGHAAAAQALYDYLHPRLQ